MGDFVHNGKYELHLIDFLSGTPSRAVLLGDAALTNNGVGEVGWTGASSRGTALDPAPFAPARTNP